MLAIRLQRHGRKGYATYRFIVQEASRSPSSGRVVAQIGSYNPHTKEISLDKEKARFYLDNGAQPSDRIVSIFKSEKVKLPEWVKEPTKQKRAIRNPDKLRKNQPAEEKPAKEAVAEEKPAEDKPTEEASTPEAASEPKDIEADADNKAEKSDDTAEPAAEDSKDEKDEEKPAEDKPKTD
jgi:small subunit ribosomal protein S16